MKLISILTLLMIGAAVSLAYGQDQQQDQTTFADRVDLRTLGRIAVHEDGRLKSFDSFASSIMRQISGPNRINEQSPTFTYMDLMLRPDVYDRMDVIYVKNKAIRRQIRQALERSQIAPQIPHLSERMDRLADTGLIAEPLLDIAEVVDVLDQLQTDLIGTAKFVNMINGARGLRNPRVLQQLWRVIPPVGDDPTRPWQPAVALTIPQAGDLGLATEDAAQLRETWSKLTDAWIVQDADAVNDAVATLALTLSSINPQLYPDAKRLAAESFYFRAYNLTWIWIFYALTLAPLLMHIVWRWPAARWIGLGMFVLTFGLHTFAIGLRWYVAQRWPNTNMFEAVTTAAWFGGVVAIILEIIAGRTRMRGVFAITSAVASGVAMMAAYYYPLKLDAGLSNRMPVLHDIWLYIHTNVIIFSYCLIFMAAIAASLYLINRVVKLIMNTPGSNDFARVGGAASLIATTPQGETYIDRPKSTFGQVLDGTTMILMELSFIMLWTGLVMGAIWADHSWGRPWGWDPKEVFALNTFIVFVVLVHVRMKTRDKGLWTALIALVGAAVMLFNWIAVNFVITGLHSYA